MQNSLKTRIQIPKCETKRQIIPYLARNQPSTCYLLLIFNRWDLFFKWILNYKGRGTYKIFWRMLGKDLLILHCIGIVVKVLHVIVVVVKIKLFWMMRLLVHRIFVIVCIFKRSHEIVTIVARSRWALRIILLSHCWSLSIEEVFHRQVISKLSWLSSHDATWFVSQKRRCYVIFS